MQTIMFSKKNGRTRNSVENIFGGRSADQLHIDSHSFGASISLREFRKGLTIIIITMRLCLNAYR